MGLVLSLLQFFCKLSLHYNGCTLGSHESTGNTTINVFLRDGEALGSFLVSVCSPVSCIACHGLDVSIITRSTIRSRTVGATAELPASPRRGWMLSPRWELAKGFDRDKRVVATFPHGVNTLLDRVPLTI